MAHEREHSHRSTNALVNAERSTVPRAGHLASQVERHVHTDDRTHAKAFYERDGTGREVYGTYYNSNEDPDFQARYNKDGRRAFVTTSSFTFVSTNNSGSDIGARNSRRAPTAIVEEASPEQEAETRRTPHHRTTPAAQPIVEEPDDDVSEVYLDDCRPPRSRDEMDHHRSPSLRHHHHLSTPSHHHREEPEMFQLSPFVHMNRMMRDPFMDDFFAGPRDPFDMMKAMQQRMSQQRAAMLGGVDPFAFFF